MGELELYGDATFHSKGTPSGPGAGFLPPSGSYVGLFVSVCVGPAPSST